MKGVDIVQFIKNFIREEEGQDVVEYALVLGLVAIAGTVALGTMAGDTGIGGLLGTVTERLGDASAAIPAIP
jgi:Flp pilus assembly pilin Flp